jgi:hypothetical protein
MFDEFNFDMPKALVEEMNLTVKLKKHWKSLTLNLEFDGGSE